MLKFKYPGLKVMDCRGNFNTRLKKLNEGMQTAEGENIKFDAIMLARAGVQRLGWADKITQVLDRNEFLYAPSQGALGIQSRTDDEETHQMLQKFNNPLAKIVVDTERTFLRALEGGCTLPIAVNTQVFNADTNEEFTNLNNHSVLTQEGLKLKIKLTGQVYNRNIKEEWFADTAKYKDQIVMIDSHEGDIHDNIEVAKQLALRMRDNGAKDFIVKQE